MVLGEVDMNKMGIIFTVLLFFTPLQASYPSEEFQKFVCDLKDELDELKFFEQCGVTYLFGVTILDEKINLLIRLYQYICCNILVAHIEKEMTINSKDQSIEQKSFSLAHRYIIGMELNDFFHNSPLSKIIICVILESLGNAVKEKYDVAFKKYLKKLISTQMTYKQILNHIKMLPDVLSEALRNLSKGIHLHEEASNII